MIIKYEKDYMRVEDEMRDYPCAMRPTGDHDDTYEVFTFDNNGNYVRIPRAKIIIDVQPREDGVMYEKVTPEYWDSFGKDLPFYE